MKPFSKILIAVGVTGFIISVVLSASLLYFYSSAKRNISDAAQNLKAIGNEFIYDTVLINTTIPFDTEIAIENSVPIDIRMLVSDSIPVILTLDLSKDSMLVTMPIDTVLKIDTALLLPDTLRLMVQGVIPIDQKFTIKKFKIPVKAQMPLNQLLKAKLNGTTEFASDIPIKLMINQKLPLNIKVPVNQKIKIDLPINQRAMVSFPARMRITGSIPIHLVVPIKIPLSKTPLKKYLDSTANDLIKIF